MLEYILMYISERYRSQIDKFLKKTFICDIFLNVVLYMRDQESLNVLGLSSHMIYDTDLFLY